MTYSCSSIYRGYANYSSTNQTWQLRVRGQLYSQPYFKLPQSTQNSLAEVFVPDVDWNQLSSHEQDNARNLTGAIFSVPKEGQQLNFTFKLAGESPGGSGGWQQSMMFPEKTNAVGEIQEFVALKGTGLPDGGVQGGVVGVVNVWTQGIECKFLLRRPERRFEILTQNLITIAGNATGYLVPEQGITILSDIDDTLRVTKFVNIIPTVSICLYGS